MFFGAAQLIIAIIIAEALYPFYSISLNHVSDLGANCNNLGQNCVVYEPGATIFNASLCILGGAVVLGAMLLRREFKSRIFLVSLGLVGVAVIGIGLFPETSWLFHDLFSGMAFYVFGPMAVAGIVVLRKPLSYFSLALGVMTLVSITLFLAGWLLNGSYTLGIGEGGMERMAIYPVLVWLLGFGGSLMTISADLSTSPLN
jgi:hypothetical membrane protein